jgi:hypothetical protein
VITIQSHKAVEEIRISLSPAPSTVSLDPAGPLTTIASISVKSHTIHIRNKFQYLQSFFQKAAWQATHEANSSAYSIPMVFIMICKRINTSHDRSHIIPLLRALNDFQCGRDFSSGLENEASLISKSTRRETFQCLVPGFEGLRERRAR